MLPKIAFTAFLMALLLMGGVLHAAPLGELSTVVGRVELMRSGQRFYVPAMEGMEIRVEDMIRTGVNGKARIHMADGSELSLAEETEFKMGAWLPEYSKDPLVGTLFRGIARAVLNRRRSSVIATPYGVIGIRGTDVTLTVKGRSAFYFLDEGQVEVSMAGQAMVLQAGYMTASYAGRKPLPTAMVKGSIGLETARGKLAGITAMDIPPSLREHAFLEEILVRWTINYAHYLTETGRNEEAETALLIAEELTARKSVRSEILLQIAGLYFYRLKDVAGALRYYERIVEEHKDSSHYENALYGAARCLHLMGRKREAYEYIERYRSLFPGGRHIDEIEHLEK